MRRNSIKICQLSPITLYKMLTFTSEFFFGVLIIDFVLGLLLNGIILIATPQHGNINQDYEVQKVIKNETISEQNLFARYRNVVERDNYTIKEPKFSFNKMAFEIYKLLDKQKAIAASTIRN